MMFIVRYPNVQVENLDATIDLYLVVANGSSMWSALPSEAFQFNSQIEAQAAIDHAGNPGVDNTTEAPVIMDLGA